MTAPQVQQVTIVCIAGPSGAGKTVLSKRLCGQEGYARIITATTRAPRKGAGEEHGVHYFFETEASFQRMLEAGELIETVDVVSKGKAYHYGTPASEVRRAAELGQPVALVLDPKGVEAVHRYCQEHGWHALRVFVNNPIEVLQERLEQRHQNDLNSVTHPETAAGRAQIDRIHETYEERRAHLEGVEQDEWVAPARNGQHTYDLVFERFDAEVENNVVAAINQKVLALQSSPSASPVGVNESVAPRRRRAVV